MYPDFYYLLKALTGIELPALSLLKTFGFFVAIGFFVGGYIIYAELKRKEDAGIVGFTIEEITTGKPIHWTQLVGSALLGFIVGYKLIGMFLQWEIASPDPLQFLFSLQGNLLVGLIAAGISFGLKYWENKKEVANGIQVKKVKTFPHIKVGDICIVAALGGFAGAKIFNALETWDSFIQDPLDSLFSSSGLTFYGGLIVATFLLWRYSKKINLDFRHLCDAAAPALILAYGIGRIGCQVSGDGDWGIYNSAYITDAQGKLAMAVSTNFEENKKPYLEYFERHKEEQIPHKPIQGVAFLPMWLFAYNYPNNVNNVGVPLPGCSGEYCSVLPQPVFPTPVYETILCLFIFLFLWRIRKKLDAPLAIFSVYLMCNGLERFFIEKIRVNYKYDWGFMQPTQAEIISVFLFLAGLVLLVWSIKNHADKSSLREELNTTLP